MRSLALRDTWLSSITLTFAVLIVLAPLIVSLYSGLLSGSYEASGSLVKGAGNLSCKNIVATTTPIINMTMFWKINEGFLKDLSVLYFTLSGLAIIYTIARPLEMKYFYVELTFTGSRVKLLFGRLTAVSSLLLIAAISSALGLAAILYVILFPGSLLDAFRLSLLLSASSVFLSIPVATLFSLIFRNSSVSILGFLGFVALCFLVGSKIELVEAMIDSTLLARNNPASLFGLAVQAIFLVISFIRIESLE